MRSVPRRLGLTLVLTLIAGLLTVVTTGTPALAGHSNQIPDGTFGAGTGTGAWWATSGAAIHTDNDELCADVAGGTAVVHDVIVGRSGMQLAAGRSYALTFDAKSTASVQLRTRVQDGVAPYTGVLDQGFTVSPGLRRYAMAFTSGITRTDGQVTFQVGGVSSAMTVCFDNVVLIETDEVSNGTFDAGIDHWWKGRAQTSIAHESGQLRIDSPGGTTNPWDDIVGISGVSLRAGKQYRLAFTGSANTARTIRAVVQTEASPWTSPLLQDFALNTSAQTYSWTFTSPLTVTAGQLLFQIGGAAGFTARFDNISVVEQPRLANDPVIYWDNVLQQAIRESVEPQRSPTNLARAAAIMHTAIFDAVTSVTNIGTPYVARVTVPVDTHATSLESAVNMAAFDTLRVLFPNLTFTDELTAARGLLPNGTIGIQRDRGEGVGAASASAVLANRANDGSTSTGTYTPSTTPGAWRPTDSTPAVTPFWGQVRPFTMTSGSQFRPPLPGGYSSYSTLLASQAYADQLNEVKNLGRATGSTRTAEQTDIAFFWANDVPGTYKPPGQLLEHTEIVAAQRGLGLLEHARLFALVSLAMADAAIAAWDAKFLTPIDLWRPQSAVQNADQDGRADTVKDAAWLPLSINPAGQRFSPAFPAYVSGHATFGGAWAAVMRGYFGFDHLEMRLTTEDPSRPTVVRTLPSFTAAAAENGRSRIYLGVHYQWDADNGVATGTQIGNRVIANFLRP
ncbi:carbohydrate binding domain-containing protein [Catenuloplanes atrovinosus]|uniref:PAP2 superfamily protein n=1 Tax=Catenuloplanes atrovinosus TaxID=137266 RepID=A0AAE3YS62_9ACTN|nr:carbohydrate binding domain-containing protein [Catenuloplanes atrovinosus]MDR7277458.1 hypothetical protein [Catenuloplanes atrovinosus]